MAIKRQTIIDAVKTRLALITVAHGYDTNLGANVNEWRSAQYDPSELPAIEVRDTVDEPAGQALSGPGNIEWHSLLVEIEFAIVIGGGATEARKGLYDIYTAIGVDQTWGGLALRTLWMGDELTVKAEDRQVAGAVARIKIEFTTNRFAES